MASEDPVSRWLAGSREALGELFEQWEPYLRQFLRRVLVNEEDVQDVVNDVFVQLLTGKHNYDPAAGAFDSWLRTVARNRAVDRLRSRAQKRQESPLAGLEPPDLADLPCERAHPEALAAADLEAVLRARLDARENELLTLMQAGFSTAEVCERMQLSQPTVWRLRRSLRDKAAELWRSAGLDHG
jgi:RNA polymerase sigma-70 factor (ECF subfamily)